MIHKLPLPAQSEILPCAPSSSTSHVRWPCTPWWRRPTVGEWWTRSLTGGQFLHGAAPSVWRHVWDDGGSCCLQTDGLRRSHCSAAQLIVSAACCAVKTHSTLSHALNQLTVSQVGCNYYTVSRIGVVMLMLYNYYYFPQVLVHHLCM